MHCQHHELTSAHVTALIRSYKTPVSVQYNMPHARKGGRQPTRAAPAPLPAVAGAASAYATRPSPKPSRGIPSEKHGFESNRGEPKSWGSVRTATALPDRRNASAGPCPIRPQVRRVLAPHSGRGTRRAQGSGSTPRLAFTLQSSVGTAMLRAGQLSPLPVRVGQPSNAWFLGDQYVHTLSIFSTEPPLYPISILREVQTFKTIFLAEPTVTVQPSLIPGLSPHRALGHLVRTPDGGFIRQRSECREPGPEL